MHRALFIMTLLSTTFHGVSSSAEEPGQPPTPLYEQTDATTSISSTQPAMSELPTRRYPMLNRPLEVAFQGGAGLALTAVPTFMGAFLLQVDGTIYPAPQPHFAQDTGEALLTSLIFTVPSSTLAVWGLGRANGSRASLLWTFVGASVGGIVGSLGYGGSEQASSNWVEGVGLIGYWAGPILGAIAGYQASSSWKSGETFYEESPALSFGFSPTRGGFAGSMGFRF